ncbi:hypothetical protein SAMN04488564_109169 [Lentzea waywayandensis]|uniref:CoA-transferase family III n=1 Tax=Lentzea waywayandensis TaxID=84724 RepID=A0A1I6F847_9PSEU|nr:hypothetical protein [Lentzea waywayandensis]SFR25993.1 hypothetical protein SAMN04488564_109169 [Lentzea waywayandensis]
MLDASCAVSPSLCAKGVRSLGPRSLKCTNASSTSPTSSSECENTRAAELAISWAGPLRGGEVTDEASAEAVCGPMHVHGRSQGSPRGLGLDHCATAAGVIGGTGLLAALFDGRSSVTTSVAQSALMTVSQYLAAAGAPEAEATALEPGGPPFLPGNLLDPVTLKKVQDYMASTTRP